MNTKHLETFVETTAVMHESALVLQLDLTDLAKCESREFEFFNEKLFELLPELNRGECDSDRASGFVGQFKTGFCLGHTIKRIAVELARQSGIDARAVYCQAVQIENRSHLYQVTVSCDNNPAIHQLISATVHIFEKIAAHESCEEIKVYKNRAIVDVKKLMREFASDSNSFAANADNADGSDGETVIETPRADQKSNVPLIVVAGTNGKTTVIGLVARAFAQIGKKVGAATDKSCGSGEQTTTDNNEPVFANYSLFDSSIEIAILETTRNRGAHSRFDYERSDVGVILNLHPIYTAQNQTETIADGLRDELQIVERVRENGTIVLNADDELLVRLGHDEKLLRVKRKIVYFSLKPNHITIKRHLLTGGTAYLLHDGWLTEADNRGETKIIRAADIPIGFDGSAEFNLANALAAAAVCRAQNLRIEAVAHALRTFRAEELDAGCANLFEIDGAYVFLDRGHNPEAFRSICKMASLWDDGRRRITGIIAAPDDADKNLIEAAGRCAARYFGRVIVRENKNLQSKNNAKEAAQTMFRAVENETPNCDCQIAADESEALRREITRLQKGDILICFYEDFELVQSILARCDAKPAVRIKAFSPASEFDLRHA